MNLVNNDDFTPGALAEEEQNGLPMDDEAGQTIRDEDSLFTALNLDRILNPLVALLNLEACEVYLRDARDGELHRRYHSGRLSHIWEQISRLDEQELFTRQMMRGEARVINLPDRRSQRMNPELKEKALGQVMCCPIMQESTPLGFFCAAHTRRNLLSEAEMSYLRSLGKWMGDVITADQKNRQMRLQVISEERERIGMDLHDGIIQSLYGIGLSIENARLSMDQENSAARDLIESSRQALKSAIDDIRAYILNLRPRQLRHSNLYEGMQSLARELRANTMIEVEMDGKPDVAAGLAREQTDALYHIFQEALSNIAKHAKATRLSVRLWRREGRLMLRVNDDGTGFDIAKPGRRAGQGLRNMQARAEAAGGGIEVVSIRRQGTTLTAWVPWIAEKSA
jgi:signal transduction histidine kinase